MRKGIAFIVSGPSGGGKTTLAKSMLHELDNLRFSVSCTTRTPREGEVDGKDYKFISEAEFEKMVQEDRFIEHAFVHGNYYGTPVDEFEDAKKSGVDLLLDIDVQGASQIKKTVKKWIGVPVSIGIAENKTLSKIANHLAKKDELGTQIVELLEQKQIT